MKNNFKIKSFKYDQLANEQSKLIKQTVNNEFGEIPIVKELSFSEPSFSFFLSIDEEIAGFANLVERSCKFDDNYYLVAGLSNLIVLPKYRATGFGSELMSFFDDFARKYTKADYGLLFCADEMIPFYEKSAWYLIDGLTSFNQPSGENFWKSNVMIKDFKNLATKLYPKKINLNGLPW